MPRLIKDSSSFEWTQVRDYCEQRIARLREDNDRHQTEESTAKIRGMIAFAKEILSLEKEDPVMEPTQDPSYLS